MAIERYDIVNTCGGHCFCTELAADGEMVFFEDHEAAMRALQAPYEALHAAHDRLVVRCAQLRIALQALLDEHDCDIHSEYDGTTQLESRLAVLQPYRDLIATAKGGAA